MLPFGHRLGTLGTQMPLLGRFGDSLKFNVFFKGPDAHFGWKITPKGDVSALTFRPLFGTLFQRVPPSVKSTLKVTFFIKKYHSFLMFFCTKHLKKQCVQTVLAVIG